MTTDFSERARQIVHIAMAGFALLLPFVRWWEAALLASVALAFNLYVLPRIGGALFRPAEGARRLVSGIVLYPAAILLLILVFPYRPDIVAASWGILAFGDGMATIVGRSAPGPRIPWNREKSLAGTAAFIVFGGAAGATLSWWCRSVVIPPPFAWFSIWAPVAAAAAAAAVETIAIRLDDNLSVPATAAAVMWGVSLVAPDAFLDAAAAARAIWAPAVLATVGVAAAGYAAGTVSFSGLLAGIVIGLTIVLGAGWAMWILLLSSFAAAVIASRMGLERKTRLGIAEERGGRRGAGNAIANTGIAAAAAAIAATSYARETALLGGVAALVAGSSDTIASEIGKAWGRGAYLVPVLRPVPPGTPGAVSLEGTAAGLVGALVLAALASVLGIVPGSAVVPIVLGATVGSIVESSMGATLEPRRIVNNDVLNFVNTAVAAAAAIHLAKVFS